MVEASGMVVYKEVEIGESQVQRQLELNGETFF